jgi:LysM repeat protein
LRPTLAAAVTGARLADAPPSEEESVGWFRDEPIDQPDESAPAAAGPADGSSIDADESLDKGAAAPEAAGVPTADDAGTAGAAADEAGTAGAAEPVVRERDRPVVTPLPTPEAEPPHRRGSRIRSVVLGLVTIVAVAAVGFVAGLMLPTVLPGPGVDPNATATPVATEPATATPVATEPATATPAASPSAPATPTAEPTVAPTQSPADTPASTQVVYIVKAGDQLARIAARYGVTVAAIQAANNIKDPNLIKVGQKLKIPLPAPTPAP